MGTGNEFPSVRYLLGRRDMPMRNSKLAEQPGRKGRNEGIAWADTTIREVFGATGYRDIDRLCKGCPREEFEALKEEFQSRLAKRFSANYQADPSAERWQFGFLMGAIDVSVAVSKHWASFNE